MNKTNVILMAMVCVGMVAAAPMMVYEADAAFRVAATCSPDDTVTISWTGQPSNAHSYGIVFSPQIGSPISTTDTSVKVDLSPGVGYTANVDVYDDMNVRIIQGVLASFQCENDAPAKVEVTELRFTLSGSHTSERLTSPDSNGVIRYHFTYSQPSFSGQFTFDLSRNVDKATFYGKEATGDPVVFPDVKLDTGCNYLPLVLTEGDYTWTVHALISHGFNDPVAFPACDTLPGELVLTGARVRSGGSWELILPAGGHGITDRPIRVSGTGENIRVEIQLFVHDGTDIRFDGVDDLGNVLKSFSLDEGCHRFDVEIKHGSSSVLKDLYVMVSPDGTGACPDVNRPVQIDDDTGGNGGNGGNDGTGNGGQAGGGQTTLPSRSGGGGGGSGGTGGGGFFIPPSFFAPPTSAPSAQSEPEPEPEPEPLPILNGTIPHIRMISIPHMDMWNGTTITPFQCNVTGGGTIHLSPMYDGMDLVHGTFEMLDISTGNVTQIMAGEHTPMNGTATYNVTAHVAATYNVTQMPPHSVLLDVQAGGYEWRISEGALVTFQDIFGMVDVLQRYQYGSIEWTVQGGSCQMPQTP